MYVSKKAALELTKQPGSELDDYEEPTAEQQEVRQQ